MPYDELEVHIKTIAAKGKACEPPPGIMIDLVYRKLRDAKRKVIQQQHEADVMDLCRLLWPFPSEGQEEAFQLDAPLLRAATAPLEEKEEIWRRTHLRDFLAEWLCEGDAKKSLVMTLISSCIKFHEEAMTKAASTLIPKIMPMLHAWRALHFCFNVLLEDDMGSS